MDGSIRIGKEIRQYVRDVIRQFVPEIEYLRFQSFAGDASEGRIGMVGKISNPLEIPLFVRVILEMQKQFRQSCGVGQQKGVRAFRVRKPDLLRNGNGRGIQELQKLIEICS